MPLRKPKAVSPEQDTGLRGVAVAPTPTMIVSWCPNCQHNVGTLGVCPVCNAACHNVRVVKCVACEGKGRNSKGRACYPCEGKGHRGVVK